MPGGARPGRSNLLLLSRWPYLLVLVDRIPFQLQSSITTTRTRMRKGQADEDGAFGRKRPTLEALRANDHLAALAGDPEKAVAVIDFLQDGAFEWKSNIIRRIDDGA